MTAPQEVVAPDSRKRLPLLVGGGLGLVLLLFLGSKVLGGGGGDEVNAVAPPAAAAATATSTPTTAAPAAPAGEAPVETFEVFTTKNPFLALRTTAVAGPTTDGVPASVSAPAAVTPPSGAVAVTPVAVKGGTPAAAATTVTSVAPAAATTTAAGGQATEPARTTRVALLDVFVEGDRLVANVRVNDTVSKVGAGDTFASNFKVVSLDSTERCGRFLFGDDQFRICRGEEVLK